MTEKITLSFQYMDEVDSTNTQLKHAAEAGAKEGTVLSAGRQTKGRGRSGHTWESPEGTSVYTSLLVYPKGICEDRLALLTPLAALAVCDAVEEHTGLSPQIKWVNDILLHEKKVCGILTERIKTRDGQNAVIIGIGINVHQKAFPPELSATATSIDLVMGRRAVKRRVLTEAVWRGFLSYYEIFLKETDLAFARRRYNDRLVNINRRCRVLDPKGAYEGTALGIDEMGRLLVDVEDGGQVTAVDAGEVSVRGIYGYV